MDLLMPSNSLTPYVDGWTVQAVMASRWLTRLYRTLRDDRQASTAIQAGAPMEERLKRLGLHGRIASLDARFNQEHPEETRAEEAAWTALVEGQAGLSAFFALTDSTDGKPSPGLRGSRTATYAAFRKAIRGFHTAFPASMAEEGVTLATRKASRTCVDAFLASADEEDPKQREQLRDALDAIVLEALEKGVAAET